MFARAARLACRLCQQHHEDHRERRDTEHEIPFMKGYAVFSVEQVDGLSAHDYAQRLTPLPLSERIESATAS